MQLITFLLLGMIILTLGLVALVLVWILTTPRQKPLSRRKLEREVNNIKKEIEDEAVIESEEELMPAKLPALAKSSNRKRI